MAKIDLDSLSIEELAALRELATVKKAEGAPIAKVRKTEEAREPKEPVAKAA